VLTILRYRFNQTLSRCVAKLCNEEQNDWDEHIPVILMGYRASKQASTKESPYYMLFQQEMRLLIDAELIDGQDHDIVSEDFDVLVDVLLESRKKCFAAANDCIKHAQQKENIVYRRFQKERRYYWKTQDKSRGKEGSMILYGQDHIL